MTKKIVSLRMTVKDVNGVTLVQMNTYGVQIGETTIRVEDRYFKAGRKAGFGKSAYIYERENGEFHKVIIDRFEKVA